MKIQPSYQPKKAGRDHSADPPRADVTVKSTRSIAESEDATPAVLGSLCTGIELKYSSKTWIGLARSMAAVD